MKVEEMAKRKRTQMTSVARAYKTHRLPYIFPIFGEEYYTPAVDVEVLRPKHTREEIEELESANPFDLGFSHKLMSMGRLRDVSNQPTAINSFRNSMFVRVDEPELVDLIVSQHSTGHEGGDVD